MFTGQYPEKHGVWRNAIALDTKATTLATCLRETGYSANYIGKWHLSLRQSLDRSRWSIAAAFAIFGRGPTHWS